MKTDLAQTNCKGIEAPRYWLRASYRTNTNERKQWPGQIERILNMSYNNRHQVLNKHAERHQKRKRKTNWAVNTKQSYNFVLSLTNAERTTPIVLLPKSTPTAVWSSV